MTEMGITILRKIWFLLLGLFLWQAQAAAQIGTIWSAAALKTKSDLVVIATWVATRDTGIKSEIGALQPPLPVIELHTEFEILSILKGEASTNYFVLRHYRLDTDRIKGGCINCGNQLDLATGTDAASCRAGSMSLVIPPTKCVYLIFLQRDSGGMFRATSGDVFPNDSIFSLHGAGR